jgi:hypothetical protein
VIAFADPVSTSLSFSLVLFRESRVPAFAFFFCCCCCFVSFFEGESEVGYCAITFCSLLFGVFLWVLLIIMMTCAKGKRELPFARFPFGLWSATGMKAPHGVASKLGRVLLFLF